MTTGSGARRVRTACSDEPASPRSERPVRAGPRGRWQLAGTRAGPHRPPVLLLALRLDQRLPGLVDGYIGPADLKTQVDMEPLRAPARLADDAAALLATIGDELAGSQRGAWLRGQVQALAMHAAVLVGDARPFEDQVAAAMGFAPTRRPDADLLAARQALDALVPGDGPLHDRLEAWDAGLEIAVERLPAVIDWLVERGRARSAALFGLPADESVRVSLVRGQPWSGYCWFDGGGRSRVDVNVDLPVRGPDLLHTIAHETYPGHHLEHAWKEAELVQAQGRMEAAILLINTPECVISEGLAEAGVALAAPLAERADLLLELFERAGLRLAEDQAAARATAERAVAMAGPRRALGAIRGNAALLRHADGRSHDEVAGYLRELGGYPTAVAEQRLAFIEHPLWRTYVFVYAEGEALVDRWLDRADSLADRTARFGRLLREPLTPADLRSPDD